jgi:hypothetical protein
VTCSILNQCIELTCRLKGVKNKLTFKELTNIALTNHEDLKWEPRPPKDHEALFQGPII